jgi:hypothetical protein
VILAAALLVLLGLGLFVGGILTGTTLFYWLCVVACVAAGVFLVLARLRMGRHPAPSAPARTRPPATQQFPAAPAGGPPTGGSPAAGRTDAPMPAGPGGARPDVEPPPPAAPAWERTAARAWEPAAAPTGSHAAPPAAEPEDDVPGPVGYAAYEPDEAPSTAAHAPRGTTRAQDAAGEPPVEEVEVTDLLVVVDLHDEVLVVDEHPRYHLGGCRWLAGRETFPLPLDEARTDGFTPCAWCEPDRTLAERERARRTGRA